jgi:hypothetical protein
VLGKLGFRPCGTAPRYSAARGAEVQCALFELELAGEEAEPAAAMAA